MVDQFVLEERTVCFFFKKDQFVDFESGRSLREFLEWGISPFQRRGQAAIFF